MRSHHLRATRHWKKVLLALAIVIGTVALFVGLFILTTYFINHWTEHLPEYSNAGQYLNFLIGIPLAIITTFIGLIVSLLFGQYTRTKDEVSILAFVEDISKPVFKELNNIADAFYIVHRAADRVSDDVVNLVNTLSEDPKEINFEDVIDRLDHEQIENIKRFENAIAFFWIAYKTLASSIHGALFLKTKYAEIAHRTPVEYIRSQLPDGDDKENISDSLKAIINDLLRWMELTTGRDLLRAFAFIPNRYTAMEYAGLVLYSPWLKLKEPVVRDQIVIKGYVINVGLAYLATLYQTLPERSSMAEAFSIVLSQRSELADRFLKEAGPNISEMTASVVDRAIKIVIETPSRLIIVLTDQGEQFYDPHLHGAIPQSKDLYTEE